MFCCRGDLLCGVPDVGYMEAGGDPKCLPSVGCDLASRLAQEATDHSLGSLALPQLLDEINGIKSDGKQYGSIDWPCG